MCLDFDGTLAPIVDDPNEARPLPGTVELLGHLAARFAAVALLSGRPADYLAKHAAAPGCAISGCTGCRRSATGMYG
jgi:trehalose 6-phosphate phosphatase